MIVRNIIDYPKKKIRPHILTQYDEQTLWWNPKENLNSEKMAKNVGYFLFLFSFLKLKNDGMNNIITLSVNRKCSKILPRDDR